MIKIDFIKEEEKYPPNDIGISRLFIDSFKDQLLFCKDSGCWYVWNGKYWEKDTKDGGIRNEMIKNLARYCNNLIMTSPDIVDSSREKLMKFYSKLFNKNYRDTIIRDAMSISPVKDSKFDNNIYLFNCQNGTYDFKTNTFKDFDREDYITNISNVYYDTSADCPRFKQYLDEVMEGKKDKIDYLMKMAAYGYTGNVNRDCFFIFYGSKTRNGKSTFVGINTYMLGTYAGTLKPATVTRKQINNGGSSATPDLASVKNARWVTISEIENGMMLDISLIKTMTGRNELKARNLYENEITFKPKFKLYFDTNFLPKMTDDTIFQSDRIHLIEFTRHFELEERDFNLMEKLQQEAPGIFNLIIEYYKKLETESFVIPQESQDTLTRYRLNSNNILAFKTAKLFDDKTAYIKASKLYDIYKEWCEEEELKFLSKKNFKEEMLKLGATYLEKEHHKNEDGVYEKTNWYKGFSISNNQTNVNQNSEQELIPLENDKDLPF